MNNELNDAHTPETAVQNELNDAHTHTPETAVQNDLNEAHSPHAAANEGQAEEDFLAVQEPTEGAGHSG